MTERDAFEAALLAELRGMAEDRRDFYAGRLAVNLFEEVILPAMDDIKRRREFDPSVSATAAFVFIPKLKQWLNERLIEIEARACPNQDTGSVE